MNKMALTDINGLWGFIRFVQTAHQKKISPIAGSNIITASDEAVILVENQSGYENLCRIISHVHRNSDQSINQIIKDRCSGLFFLSHSENTLPVSYTHLTLPTNVAV